MNLKTFRIESKGLTDYKKYQDLIVKLDNIEDQKIALLEGWKNKNLKIY